MRRATNSLAVHITFTVDEDKIQEDKKKARETVQDSGHQGKDKAAAPAEKGKDQALRRSRGVAPFSRQR